MAKELPYFRFTVQEWQNGDITLEGMDIQGVFINACCYYWLSNCSITLAKLKQRLSCDCASVTVLVERGIIKHDFASDEISIDFMDEQWELLSSLRQKRQIAGKRGGKKKASNAKAKPKQSSSYKDKDKDKDKDKLEGRSLKFRKDVGVYLGQYTREMLSGFFDYWTEPNKSKTKMRFEMEKTWDLSRRLNKWASNDKGFGKSLTGNRLEDGPGPLPTYEPPPIPEERTEAEKAEFHKQRKKLGL